MFERLISKSFSWLETFAEAIGLFLKTYAIDFPPFRVKLPPDFGF